MSKQSKYSTSQSTISIRSSDPTGADIIISAPALAAPWTRFGFLWGVTLSRLLDGAFARFTQLGGRKARFPIRFASQTSLKILEGWRAHAYQDGGGVWTIGWGRTEGVAPNDVTTQEKEQVWLDAEIAEISAHLKRIVKVPLSQSQFDALVLWSFNVGRGAVSRSTLIKVLNQGQYDRVPHELERWVYDNGKLVEGLRRRRSFEAHKWQTT